VIALLCGSLPLGFAFAAIGHLGAERHEGLALVLSAALPLVLYALAARVLLRKKGDSS